MEGSTDKHKEIIKYLKDEIYVKRMGKDGLHPPLGVKHCDKSCVVALIVPLLVLKEIRLGLTFGQKLMLK